MAKNDYRTTGEVGVPCPRCKKPTQVREHKTMREKHFKQPYYFSKWYFCANAACPVKIHMDERFKVWNRNEAARTLKLLQEDRAKQNFVHTL